MKTYYFKNGSLYTSKGNKSKKSINDITKGE